MTQKLTYQLSYGTESTAVNPIDTSGKVISTLDHKTMRYAREWGGELVFTGADFDRITSQPVCTEFTVAITRVCDPAAPYFTGYFTRYDCQFDYDAETVTVTMKEKADTYCLDRIAEMKFNVLNLQTAYVFWYQSYQYNIQTEYVEKISASITIASMANVVYYDGGCVRPDRPYEQYLNVMLPVDNRDAWYVDEVHLKGMQQSGGMIIGQATYCRFIRNFIIIPDQIDGLPYNPDPTNFVELEATTLNGMAAHKFGIINLYYNMTPADFTYIVEENLLSPPCTKNFVTYVMQQTGTTAYAPNRGYLLKDIIEVFSNECELVYFSEFFDGSENPLLNPHEFTANPLNNCLLIPAVDVFGTWTNGPYTGVMQIDLQMTFAELMDELAVTFNVGWHIDDLGRLRIEHRSYFDNGYSYTAPVVGIDLTDSIYADYVRNTNQVTYKSGEFVAAERWEWPASQQQFKGFPIEYDCTGERVEVYANRFFIADVESIRDSKGISDIRDKFYIAVVNQSIPYATYNAFYSVIYKSLTITGLTMLNGFLTRINLHDKFFRHGRFLPEGWLNGVRVDFTSARPLGEQTPITIPWCCETLTLTDRVTTALGDGVIQQAEEDLINDALILTLLYE